MKRRNFITLLGSAAAWPFAAHAQQPTMPVIGFFYLTSPELARENLASFRRGLGETGYIEGRNVAIEYRWAHGKNNQLATLVAELVRRQVSVIFTLESTQGALAAKAATQTIPIVFMQAADPVRIGLVDSLNRPGGNVTGINLMWAEVAGKRLELLLELVPNAKSIAYLRNPTNPVFAESEARELQAAADAHAIRLLFVNASRPSEFETAFADLGQQRADALVVSSAVSLLTDPDQIVALAARHAVPAMAIHLAVLIVLVTYFLLGPYSAGQRDFLMSIPTAEDREHGRFYLMLVGAFAMTAALIKPSISREF